MSSYTLEPVGLIRSTVKGREDAPRQGPEGAPDAWLEGARLKIGPIEAFDGTPVVDIKSASTRADE